jgi:hypothetical protein
MLDDALVPFLDPATDEVTGVASGLTAVAGPASVFDEFLGCAIAPEEAGDGYELDVH